MNAPDAVNVTVWWTPDCGYLHVETNPLTVPFHCPDDVTPVEASDESAK